MATLRPTLANKGYKNWVKGGLALKFAKEGIENFVERNIDTFHQYILNGLSTGTLCYSCSTENIIKCRYNNSFCKFSKNICKVHDPKDPTKKCRPCPNSVCNVIRDEIFNKHRFHGPSWKNSNSSRWCLDPWQLATCYMSEGYSAAISASDTDFTGLVSVIINNKIFDTEVTDNLTNKNNLFCQARAARNAILHKASMSLSDPELVDYITTLNNMLLDSKCLAGHPSAIQARTLLQQLLNGTINVTEKDEAEVLAEALRAIDDKTSKAIAAVNKETDGARGLLKSDKDLAVTAISKEKDNARNNIKSGKDDALTAISKENDNARDKIKSNKDEALTAISKQKDNARDDIKSNKDEALSAIRNEKDNASDDIKSNKDEALTAISKEKDNARDNIKSNKDEALTAISKEKDNARDNIKSNQDEILTAISKERENTRDDIKFDKNEAFTAISKERENAIDDIKANKDKVMTDINTEIAKAEVTITSKRDEAVTTIDMKERLTIEALQDALIEAKRIIKEKEEEVDSYEKIKQGLKAELLSVYQDGEHLTTRLSPLDPSEVKHIDKLYVTPNIKLINHRRVQNNIERDVKTFKEILKGENKEIFVVGEAGKNDIEGDVKTYKDVLKGENKKIFVVGEAGTGKTAFCQEMVSTWCQVQNRTIVKMSDNQQAISNFDFLFYISLRDAITQSSVDEMIKHLLLPNKPSLHEPLLKVLAEERCLVVLDGLDEWTTENKTAASSNINKGIPGRDRIRNCTVVTTTRPWKLEVLQLAFSQIDIKFELLGINKTSFEQLAQNMITHLNYSYRTNKMYDDFVLQLEKKKFNELRTIPVVLKQVICLWHSGKELGKTKSVIYCQMLELFLELAKPRLEKDLQYQQEKEEWMKSSIKLSSCFDDHESCQKSKPLLFVLSKLAFQTLLSDNQESSLVFRSTTEGCHHLSPAEVNFCLKIGVLCQDKILKNSAFPFKKISFLHKTFQEFLAAMFVSLDQSNTEHCVETIQQFCNSNRKCREMSNVLTFISGICPSDITCRLLDHYNTKVYDRQPMIIHCISEGWTCFHDNKHVYRDRIDIREHSEYLDKLCKVNIPNVKELNIWSSPTDQCLQQLLQIHTLERLEICPSRHLSPISEDFVYDLVHNHRHTLTSIIIRYMKLRSNTRLSTLLHKVPHLVGLYIGHTTLPQQLWTSIQALHSPPDRCVKIYKPTILPDTEPTD